MNTANYHEEELTSFDLYFVEIMALLFSLLGFYIINYKLSNEKLIKIETSHSRKNSTISSND